MSLWHETMDFIGAIDDANDDLSVDQKLKLAEIMAILSVSQELSRIHNQGINSKFDP